MLTPSRLRRWREGLKLKQYEVAKLLAVHKQTVCNWERGFNPIPKWLPQALERVGDPDIAPDLSDIEKSRRWDWTTIVRVFHRSIETDAKGCWVWTALKSDNGYGLYRTGKRIAGISYAA